MQENQTELRGLSSEEVRARVEAGKVNTASTVKTKSVRRIFYDNICTVFNLINVLLFVALLLVGSYKNMLFIGVVVLNSIIGIVQEIRSKKSVDTLTILTESKLDVLRDGKTVHLSKDELVLDDVIVLSRGNQVPADCVLVQGACKANESLLTGESNLIEKRAGDELLSGSFIAAGTCYCRVNRVGADSYAAKINNEARYIKKNNSQILKSFKFIINICTAIIVPVGALLFCSSYFFRGNTMQDSVVSTVGALVGMIPAGMILLTGSVLAVSVIRLSRKKVLVNEMYCIETLARVDVICLDKTGTLTADKMNVHQVINLNTNDDKIKTALASVVAASDEINATLQAVSDYTQGITPVECTHFVPFSSETKWSGGSFANGKTYIMGAAEFVFSDKEKYPEIYENINRITETVRILVLGSSDLPVGSGIPADLHPMALILIKDQLRDNVCETVDYFKEQGVTLKVISGDSVKTVKNIALDTGIAGAEHAVDMTTVKTDEQLEEVAERCNVFGRVTPALGGDGFGQRGGAQRVADRARQQRLCRDAARRRGGQAHHQQHRAQLVAVSGQNDLLYFAGGILHLLAPALSVPAHPAHAHQFADRGVPVLRAGAAAEQEHRARQLHLQYHRARRARGDLRRAQRGAHGGTEQSVRHFAAGAVDHRGRRDRPDLPDADRQAVRPVQRPARRHARRQRRRYRDRRDLLSQILHARPAAFRRGDHAGGVRVAGGAAVQRALQHRRPLYRDIQEEKVIL